MLKVRAIVPMSYEMTEVPAAERRGAESLARERFIWWFRCAALAFLVVQTTIEPGDLPVLSWVVAVLFGSSILGTGLALRGEPPTGRVRAVGIAAMATDVVVVLSVLANNLTDPAEPVYLVGVLAMLEATMRWRHRGGVVGGVLAGLAAGGWTVVVSLRTSEVSNVDYATMRAGVVVVLGIFLSSLVRQLTEQHATLQGILDTARDLIVSVGMDGHVHSVNGALDEVLGYHPSELVGRPYQDLIHPDDLQNPNGPAPLDRGARLVERRVRARDGSYRWMELNLAAGPDGDVLHVSARDVTERREIRRRVEESEQRFRSLFEQNTDAVYAIDLEGRFSMANPAAEVISGHTRDELLGMPFAALIDPDRMGETVERFAAAAGGEAQNYETAIVHRSGHRVDLDVTNVPIVVDGEIVGVFGVAKDVTERRRLERELGHQATHDTLTGLANRAVLELALDAAATDGRPRTLLFIDLDRFKLVNDSLGHRSGDELLLATVERLRAHVRANDLLVRWAGDEFCALLGPGTTHEVALRVADRLRAVLAEPFSVAGREVRLSASIGVASASAAGTERLVQAADLAMYEAKRAGRDRVCVYSGEAETPALHQLDIESELDAALTRDEVLVHYQPIVHTATGEVRAVEALARWPQPDGTVRLPREFVAIAEQSGLIRRLTRRVVGEACRQLGRWDRLGLPTGDLQAWVNISVADLESVSFAEEVRSALAAVGIAPARLVLEVTETMLMRDAEQVQRTIEDLRGAGVSLAIDDFGTGYSSLSQLHRLRVAACKVDREFVTLAPRRDADAVILQALVDVGTAFGLPVVAEGIEQADELAAVLATGCPLAQGYLLGAPAPGAALEERLAAAPVPLAELRASLAVPSAR
jgi:diguanylate cyclase (GGDEF)-like protein/PAS domain S-box-containing protein